ncbi:MAG: glycogen/starch/alpha-glucan phosphorylase [Deltaproteobacteria bacterium]|nr:glycogen/starch/alpha-glucan phosphorylase [Deltaproteobacteria bacterium]
MSLDELTGQRDQKATLREKILRHVAYSLAKPWRDLSTQDLFQAISLAAREYLTDGMMATEARYQRADAKRLYYLSMEFLMGRSLGNNLHNLGLFETCQQALLDLGVDLEEVRAVEPDAALGNGGLGRLAACFLDSLATLGMPGYGYGLNYEFGLFRQRITNGYQQERPDHWLQNGTPWQIERPEEACLVPIYGSIEHGTDLHGDYNPMWLGWKVLIGLPYDMPIVGHGGKTVNVLRLYAARASDEFDMEIFNDGDYLKAVEDKILSETISKVLYPSDAATAGRELRLLQEYFLVACAVRDIVRRYLQQHTDFNGFADKVAIQLNDTHPALTVAELMRLLVDEHSLPWEHAWDLTQATLGYTNHTLLSEALEKWPVSLIERVLPRHLQIIYEINHRFLQQVARVWPDDVARCQRMSIIEEGATKQVRMAHLAMVGSHSINGVAQLHSELVKSSLAPDFYQLWPERFNNKTNGVTQRRWLLKANPSLAKLISETISDRWITELSSLKALEPYATDPGFQNKFRAAKRTNKIQLAKVVLTAVRVPIDPDSLFIIQAKRLHEYKRQLLNALHVIHQYLSIVEDGQDLPVPHTYIFAGKAAPGYWAAKQVVKLVNNLGQTINRDARVRDQLKVIFLPDYRVSLAEKLIPAANLSEQISTAGKEASGTGNMKFALNGALTIGTLDGANIEILEEVGEENIFIFGKTAQELTTLRNSGYQPWEWHHRSPDLQRVLAAVQSDRFCQQEPGLFQWIYDSLLHQGDEYFLLADFDAYTAAHAEAGRQFRDSATWDRKAILNIARMGKFSSDRTIREYAEDIWHLTAVG